jgi:hypothetical protein
MPRSATARIWRLLAAGPCCYRRLNALARRAAPVRIIVQTSVRPNGRRTRRRSRSAAAALRVGDGARLAALCAAAHILLDVAASRQHVAEPSASALDA